MKEGSSAHDELAAIESLRGSLPAKAQAELDAYERSVKAGVAGEDRILYELKNSHMDMVVLQDLFLEHNGLTAQIDFMVLTRQRYFAIECKNLYGNIQVDAQGSFIRYLGGGRREGMYSPITQNRRHLELIRAIRRDNHGVAFNLIADRTFDDQFRSLVVLANPKTVLNDRYAPDDVKAQIIRADQLIATIESINAQPGLGHSRLSLSDMRKAGEDMLSLNAENSVNYVEKFRKMTEEHAKEQVAQPPAAAPAAAQAGPGVCPRCGSPLVLRTAKRGPRAGKQFYGCSSYPHCRFIRNVD
ncbi:MAG: NERD domain-containing protein [Eggerthellaceae bacterium]|nr:NERD domain-containing protein [Eggerthellaceae bacterium]